MSIGDTKVCPKCNQSIKPFEKIRFISGVTVLDQDGDFVISEDVFSKPIIYHIECLKIKHTHPKENLIKQITGLDNQATFSVVEKFIDENLEKSDQDIITSWFKRY